MGESVDALCLQYGIKPLELPPRVNSTPRSAAEAAEARGVLPLIGAANRDDRELYCLGRRLFRARWMESVARLIETGPGGPIQDALAPLVGAYARGALPYGEIRPHLLPLIEDLYELCHADDPELDEVEYNFDEPLIGEGWHARERTANRTELPYRWIGPLPWATIHFRLRKGVAYRLRFRCCLHLDPGVAKSISVHANGQALPVDRMEAVHTLAGEKLMYEARIPAEATAGPPLFLKLTFVVARTMKPSEMDAGSADNRALGVALDWISIAPLIARADPAARTAQAADLAQAV